MTRNAIRVGSVATLLAALCAPTAAAAQEAPHPTRFRFGAGLVSGQALVPYGSYSTSVVTVLGLGVRLGVQIDDRFAVAYQTNATVLWPHWGNAVLFEWTPTEYFTLGAGPSVDVLAAVPNGAGSSDADVSLGGDVRFAVNVPVHSRPDGRRYGVSFSVDLTPAYAWVLQGGVANGFQLGVMGGIGFEMY
jgi:hypothetical protein